MTAIFRRLLRTLLSAALLLMGVFASLASSAGTAGAERAPAVLGVSQPTPALHSFTIGPPRIVDPRHLPASAPADHPPLPRPFFSGSGGTGTARTHGIVNATPQGRQTAAESVLTKFAGMNESRQVGLFGFDQALGTTRRSDRRRPVQRRGDGERHGVNLEQGRGVVQLDGSEHFLQHPARLLLQRPARAL